MTSGRETYWGLPGTSVLAARIAGWSVAGLGERQKNLYLLTAGRPDCPGLTWYGLPAQTPPDRCHQEFTLEYKPRRPRAGPPLHALAALDEAFAAGGALVDLMRAINMPRGQVFPDGEGGVAPRPRRFWGHVFGQTSDPRQLIAGPMRDRGV